MLKSKKKTIGREIRLKLLTAAGAEVAAPISVTFGSGKNRDRGDRDDMSDRHQRNDRGGDRHDDFSHGSGFRSDRQGGGHQAHRGGGGRGSTFRGGRGGGRGRGGRPAQQPKKEVNAGDLDADLDDYFGQTDGDAFVE